MFRYSHDNIFRITAYNGRIIYFNLTRNHTIITRRRWDKIRICRHALSCSYRDQIDPESYIGRYVIKNRIIFFIHRRHFASRV